MVIPALSSQTVSGMKSLSFIDITIDCGKCLRKEDKMRH
nr:MAG TPA: Prion-related protein testis-specific [Caudoviricetes sp.]DAI95863.1 MAG TPA: Prion-related protein testis-specific [Caudoviricetes sp.]DAL68378.1 MAG TPA: Prion-related protein testis-specific [Bacteriophage sp.]